MGGGDQPDIKKQINIVNANGIFSYCSGCLVFYEGSTQLEGKKAKNLI